MGMGMSMGLCYGMKEEGEEGRERRKRKKLS
jgi:hypothetical protein